MSDKTKEILILMAVTFAEGALSYLFVQASGIDFKDKQALKVILLGAIGAGISAVYNICRKKIQSSAVNEDLPEDYDEELTNDDI